MASAHRALMEAYEEMERLRQWGEEYQAANDACERRWNETRNERDRYREALEKIAGDKPRVGMAARDIAQKALAA
jgi:hypothetical protein